MPAAIDLSGRKFGMLTAIGRTGKLTPAGQHIWKCVCDCGKISETRVGNLTCGRSKSCGCLQKRKGKDHPNWKHGLSQQRGTEAHKIYQREKFDKHRYNLLPEHKTAIIEAQKNRCAICEYQFGQKIGDMHVDHCHTTGAIRGMLCDRCNRGLGYFRDNPTSLHKAAEYINTSRAR